MRNEYLEKVHDVLRDALQEALATKEIHMLYHPILSRLMTISGNEELLGPRPR